MDFAIWVEKFRETQFKAPMRKVKIRDGNGNVTEVKKNLEPWYKKTIVAAGGLVTFGLPLIISPYFFHRWGDVL